MGRRRTFIENEAIDSATAVFAERGFAGASVDDLVRATGVNRASLYGVFGSKDGLFQRCLTEALAALSAAAAPGDSADAAEAGREELDLVLVALMELAPEDAAVREALEVALDRAEITAEALGRRLLERAGAATSSSASSAPTASASPPT
ncbi:TetR/AcrR family transcriptional regulator [Actinomyces oris]|uniref:TetR/AcrR family transcriptional regulator n=1 Tax=Actinomyces oris TaxID=544580 RepID=UPI00094E54E2|nr:TetR/AcrR family transcriptional regulator [Actinomyces oris]OLO57984.1 TetR family transcriptional regulator [Actinomyces oris]